MEHRKTTAESTHGKSETNTASGLFINAKKRCSLSTTYNGEKTNRKQRK